MGFPTTHVLTNDELVSEFLCKICFQLVEHPAYTACTHVFCASCLSDWLNQNPSCPACKAPLGPRDVAELKAANPLAWRVLSRVQCRCPVQGCVWRGDYSELSSHLTNSESHTKSSLESATKTSILAEAEALKEQGNRHFEQRAFRDAIKLYNKAISIAPDVASYYGNRAAAWLMLEVYRECIADCQHAIRLDPMYAKGYIRMAKALCTMGEFGKAAQELDRAMALQPQSAELAEELGRVRALQQQMDAGLQAYHTGDFEQARAVFGALMHVTTAHTVLLWLARSEVKMGICDRALRLTLQVIRADSQNAEAYAVRGIALFLSKDLDQAVKHLTEAIRLNPDDHEAARAFKRARKVQNTLKEARDKVEVREFQAGLDFYTEAILTAEAPPHAPISALLHAERGTCHLRLERYESCLEDCGIAIYAEDDYRDAWLTKVTALHKLGRHTEAVEDMEHLMQIHGGDTKVQHWYERAKFEVRKQRRTDYYALLQVSRLASELEIKQSYKQLALEWHPDKHTDNEDKRKEAEERFKLMGEALEILTDTFKRQLYDEGYDKEAIEERVAAAQKAAHEHKPRHY